MASLSRVMNVPHPGGSVIINVNTSCVETLITACKYLSRSHASSQLRLFNLIFKEEEGGREGREGERERERERE